MGVRRAAAVNAARLTAVASRALGKGGGTTVPGLVAMKLDPTIVRELGTELPNGSIVVSGTNGKTTTSRILSTILLEAGYTPVRNEAGSNLLRGLATSLVRETTLFGNMAAGDRALGVFEVDEAALPGVLASIEPTTLLLLDLFRDQLDRYGEVAIVAALWTRAVERLERSTTIVANADDPLVTFAAKSAPGNTRHFGIESAGRASLDLEHASDVKACPRCGGHITYSTTFLGHLGHYRCDNCTFERPVPLVVAHDVKLQGVRGSTFRLAIDHEEISVQLPLPGMYNVYNAIAAAAAADARGIDISVIQRGLQAATPAFGRMERVDVDGRTVYLALAKNPAGLNEVMRTMAESDTQLHLLVMLNDDIADGRDVSWIWDADVEMLAGKVSNAVFAGHRAPDMALRFKYASVVDPGTAAGWSVESNSEAAWRLAVDQTPAGSILFVVPTYTAMLDIRAVMARQGYVKNYWEG